MVAKHGRKKNYCSVCRTDYEDYLLVRTFTRSISRTILTGSSSGPTSSASTSSKLSSGSGNSHAHLNHSSSRSWRRSWWTRPTSRRRQQNTWPYRLTDVFTTFFIPRIHTHHRFSASASSDSNDSPFRSRKPAPLAFHNVKCLPYCQKDKIVERSLDISSFTGCSGRWFFEASILLLASKSIL